MTDYHCLRSISLITESKNILLKKINFSVKLNRKINAINKNLIVKTENEVLIVYDF